MQFNILKLFCNIPKHMIVAASAWLSRIIVAFVQLISVRILTDGLGTEQYAIFALLIGLMGWYGLADLGVGSSLQNFVSELRAKEKDYTQYIIVASTLSICLFLLCILILYLLSPYLGSLFLREFDFLNVQKKTNYFFVVGILSTGIALCGISYKVWYAQLRGYLSNIVPGVASLISLMGVWWVSHSEVQDKLFWNLFAYLAPSTLLALVSFVKQIISIKFNVFRFRLNILSNILKRAIQFWFFALMATIVLQIDYIVLSQFINTQDIIVYNITTKIFLLASFVYNAILMALWPIFTEMNTKQEWNGIKKQISKYISIGVAFMVVSTVIIVMLMSFILKVISPSTDISIPINFIILVGIYNVIRIWTDSYAMALQSMSNMRPFWFWVPIQAVISVGFQWFLTPIYGLYGIVIGLCVSYLLTVTWSLPMSLSSHIMKLRRIANDN